MNEQISISSREELQTFQQGISSEYEVLIDSRFDISIELRKKLQNEIFGEEDTPENRNKLFFWLWERKPHICEETGTFLGYTMQAEFMSHILSRGAHIEMWNDPRNINILSPDAHRKWETGKREKMRIWDKNKITILHLKMDYSKLKTYKAFPGALLTKDDAIKDCATKYATKEDGSINLMEKRAFIAGADFALKL